MAEHRNSSVPEGVSVYAEGTALNNKFPLIVAKFSLNSVPEQPGVFEEYNSDMAEEEINEILHGVQFRDNTYELFHEFFPDMTDEEVGKARYREQFSNRYEKLATLPLNPLSHPTLLDGFEDSLPKVDVPHRDNDDCGCSICLEYYRGTDKAFSPADASKGPGASSSSSGFISVSEPKKVEDHVEAQVIPNSVLSVKDNFYNPADSSWAELESCYSPFE